MKTGPILELVALMVVLSISFRCFPQTPDEQSAASAKHFVESLYSRYGQAKDPPNLFEENANQAFDYSLIALARADAKATRPDVGVLDYDPICNCQDPDIKFPDLKIVITSANANRAEAIVKFTMDNTPNKLALTLIKGKDGWRIFNIEDLTGSGPHTDIRIMLKKEIRELSSKKNSR
jgi:hypothetical protein